MTNNLDGVYCVYFTGKISLTQAVNCGGAGGGGSIFQSHVGQFENKEC